MNEALKFCKDCKHMREFICGNPLVGIFDVATGERQHLTCYEARTQVAKPISPGLAPVWCGCYRAEYFEPKENGQ